RAVQLLRLSCPRRRRYWTSTDGRQVDLRQLAGADLPHHYRGTAERDAFLRRSYTGRTGVAARLLCPLTLRPRAGGDGLSPLRRDAGQKGRGEEVNGFQSAMHPAGVQASELHHLWNIFLCVSIVVYGITLAAVLIAVRRSHRRTEPLADAPSERRATIAVAIGAGMTFVTVLALLVASVATGRTVGTLGRLGTAHLEIDVTGHQWWWEVTYPNSEPDKSIRTANEIHIPVGKPVELRLATRDVIHSLWIPNLHGKRDLIPGRVNKFWIEADRPGVFRGQCAEFCGLQHANMAFLVIAQPPAAFEAWRQAQLKSAAPPTDPVAGRGRQVFLNAPCLSCHAIQGEVAGSGVGPDLTHVGSRATLAAGAL